MFKFFVETNQNLKIILFYRFPRKKPLQVRKTPQNSEGELLNLLKESDAVKEQEFSMKNIIDQRKVIGIIKRYEEVITTGNKKQ